MRWREGSASHDKGIDHKRSHNNSSPKEETRQIPFFMEKDQGTGYGKRNLEVIGHRKESRIRLSLSKVPQENADARSE